MSRQFTRSVVTGVFAVASITAAQTAMANCENEKSCLGDDYIKIFLDGNKHASQGEIPAFPPGFKIPAGFEIPPDGKIPPGIKLPPDFKIPAEIKIPKRALPSSIPSYLTVPASLFQARLFDIDTWHRRLGDSTRNISASNAHNGFLRIYGGNYNYRAGAKEDEIGFDATTRYRALQAGVTPYTVDVKNGVWRFGFAASFGNLAFEPDDVNGSRKTRMMVWSVSPTATWQSNSDAYIDALVAFGKFRGDVSTRDHDKTATLQGKSLAISIETGIPIRVNQFKLVPHAQVVVQRLNFKRTRDIDGFDVNLGVQTQVTLRAGSEIRRVWETAKGDVVQVFTKVRVAHTPGKQGSIRAGNNTLMVSKAGIALEAGLGFNATLNKGHTLIYADVTHENRLGRRGYQGWTLNAGVRVHF